MKSLTLKDFGILEEDVKNLNYLLGLDFGHGETTLAYWKFNGRGVDGNTPIDLKFDTNNGEPKKLFTALYVNKNGEYKLLPSNVTVPERPFYLGFKRKPELLMTGERYPGDDNMTCKQLVQTFIRMVLQGTANAEENNSNVDLSGNGILAVGCPSSEEWLSYAPEYARIIAEGIQNSGLSLKVIIIPESRASILKVYNQNISEKYDGKPLKDVMQRGAVVFDFGSSTLDATFVNFATGTMWDDSIPLGASLIEEMMLEKTMEDNGRSEDDLTNVSQSKLSMRQAKENWFTTDEKNKFYLMCKDDDDIRVTVNDAFVNCCVSTLSTGYNSKSGIVEGTWRMLAEKFIEAGRTKWLEKTCTEDFDGLVMITGGASNMQFVKDMPVTYFPNATVIPDYDPSYCVSRGLIYALNTDLLAMKLQEQILAEISKVMSQLIDIFRNITGKRLSELVYEHLRYAMDDWVDNGNNVTFNQMVRNASNELLTNRRKDIVITIKKAFNDFLVSNDDGSLRTVIAGIVMNTFSDMFPGKITPENMQSFQIPEDFWGDNEEIGNSVSLDVDNILSTLDLDSALKTGTIVVLLIPLLVLSFTLAIIDELFGCSLTDKLDRLLNSNGNKVYNQEERKKCVERLRSRKDKTLDSIYKSIMKTLIPQGSPEAQRFCQQIDNIVKPVVEKSINQVSLYF